MQQILVLNGPNLNLLGKREAQIYGNQSLENLADDLTEFAAKYNANLEFFQSNSEVELIDKIQANDGAKFIIFNPAAFTHTSIALRDALLGTDSSFIEVHISNPKSREEFRKVSYFSDIAEAVILGCGLKGYRYALETAIEMLKQE